MSDGPMLGRFRVSTFVLSEARDTVYDGSTRENNPLSERTAIRVPLLMVDYRITTRLGIQATLDVPLIAMRRAEHTHGAASKEFAVRAIDLPVRIVEKGSDQSRKRKAYFPRSKQGRPERYHGKPQDCP